MVSREGTVSPMFFAEDSDIAALLSRQPRPPNPLSTIPRPRVTALIDAGAGAALCIVRGPRDLGKSVALGHWAAGTRREVLWLHLTEESAAPTRFWQQLQMALGPKLLPRSPGAARPIHPAHQLAARLGGTGPFTLVLEDFHRVQDATVQEGLLELLAHAPELNIIVATRSALDIEVKYPTITTDFHVIGPESLQFNDAEARDFHAGTDLEPVSGRLNEQLNGAPMLHKSARYAAREPRRSTLELTDDIIDKVTTSLHQQLAASQEIPDGPLTGFMAATLPLSHFDLALARTVDPGCPDPESVLRALVEVGILWPTTVNGTLRYCYPEIVANALKALFFDGLAERRNITLDIAATVEFARGEYLPAFSYAVANGDYQRGSSMLLRSGLTLLFEAQAEFAAALKTIPHTEIVKYPLLSLALGLVYNADKLTQSKAAEYFSLALTTSKLLGRALPPEERLAMNMAQAVAQRMTGQFKLAAASSRTSLRDRSELPLADRDQIAPFESVALAEWGLALIFTGDFTTATVALQSAVSTAHAAEAHQTLFFATSLLAYRYALDGDLVTAADFAESAQVCMPVAPPAPLYEQTPLFMTLAMVELGRLQPEAAAAHLDKVLSEAATSEFWGRLRIIEAQIDLLRGHSGMATGRLDLVLAQKNELPALNPFDAAALPVTRSALLLARGNATGAAAVLGRSASKSPPARIALARLSLSLGHPAEVVELLSADPRHATAVQALDAWVLLAVARLQLQDAEALQADIEKVSGAVTALGNQWPLALLPEEALELLTSAGEEHGVPFLSTPVPSDARMPASLSRISLTPREASVLATLATTPDRAEIARIHFVSLNTIKSQLRTLYKKLGVGTREDALVVAHQEHLLTS